MTQHRPTDEDATTAANTPKDNHVYAVFDATDQAERAEGALAAAGFTCQRLHPHVSAGAFKEPAPSASPLAKLQRQLGRIGGETHDAERYAWHLEHGHPILIVAADNRDAAVRIADLVKGHGAYDVTYFAALAKEYLSPEANAAHDLPTFATTNLESTE